MLYTGVWEATFLEQDLKTSFFWRHPIVPADCCQDVIQSSKRTRLAATGPQKCKWTSASGT